MSTHAATSSAFLWFLDTLVRVQIPPDRAEDRMSMIESLARHADSPPRHVHEREDEAFYVLEGELRLEVDGATLRLGPGDGALAPRGSVHTYRVESDTARWLAVTTGADFAGLVRSLARPAEHPDLPAPAGPPTPEQVDALGAAAARHHISLVDAPLA